MFFPSFIALSLYHLCVSCSIFISLAYLSGKKSFSNCCISLSFSIFQLVPIIKPELHAWHNFCCSTQMFSPWYHFDGIQTGIVPVETTIGQRTSCLISWLFEINFSKIWMMLRWKHLSTMTKIVYRVQFRLYDLWSWQGRFFYYWSKPFCICLSVCLYPYHRPCTYFFVSFNLEISLSTLIS